MNLYKQVPGNFVIPDNADLETVLRKLGTDFYIDTVAGPIQQDPHLFFIKEIKITNKK